MSNQPQTRPWFRLATFSRPSQPRTPAPTPAPRPSQPQTSAPTSAPQPSQPQTSAPTSAPRPSQPQTPTPAPAPRPSQPQTPTPAPAPRPSQPQTPTPAPVPRPQTQPPVPSMPRPGLGRPTVRPPGATQPPPAQETAPRAPAPTTSAPAPPSAASVAPSPSPALATTTSAPRAPVPAAVAQPPAPDIRSPLAVTKTPTPPSPASPVSQKSPPTSFSPPKSKIQASPPPLATFPSVPVPPTKPLYPATSVPASRKPPSPSSPPKASSSPMKQVTAPMVPTFSVPKPSAVAARVSSPTESPRAAKPLPETPPQSPRTKASLAPPSPLALPPSQLKSEGEHGAKFPTEAEKKTVVVQQTGKSQGGMYVKPKDRDLSKTPSDSEDSGRRVITISGENKGAVMELGYLPRRRGSSLSGPAPHKLKSDGHQLSEGNLSRNEEKSKMEARNHNAAPKSSVPMHTFMNSNVQGINSSVVYNSSLSHHDPGAHLSIARKPLDGHGHGFQLKDHAKEKNIQKEKGLSFSN